MVNPFTRIAGLSDKKRRLLELLIDEAQPIMNRNGGFRISKRPQRDFYPLSFAQQRVWFLCQLEPGNPFYNEFSAIRLRGSLNLPALQECLDEIQRRHEILRTIFPIVQDQPAQFICEADGAPVSVVDCREIDVSRRPTLLQEVTREEVHRPFDLTAGPLLRALLLWLNAKEYLLIVITHHIVADHWSMSLFVKEVAVLYEAFLSGTPSNLPMPPIQYADFAVWQRNIVSELLFQTHLEYWRRRLDGLPQILTLPPDRPRPLKRVYRGAMHSIMLSERLTWEFKGLSQRRGLTLFMVLLAGFQTLLARYSGQNDIVTGVPTAGRNLPELDHLIGFFLNPLVIRTDFSGDPTIAELLDRIQEVCLGAYAHQDAPFEKVVEELRPERGLTHTPLFQVIFLFQNTPKPNVNLRGLQLSNEGLDVGRIKFDFSLYMAEQDGKMLVLAQYDAELYEKTSIERMVEHLKNLLEGITTEPERCLSTLSMLGHSERQQILKDWNRTDARYPHTLCVHELVERQVERRPDAVAVEAEQELSFGGLNRRADRLARRLRELGVGPEVVVGICLERRTELLISILGVMKAGGVYLPLEPSYPVRRLAYMLREARARVLLSERKRAEFDWLEQIRPESDQRGEVRESAASMESQVGPDNLVYLIYTSGSTGEPKGVEIRHGAVVNFLDAMGREIGVGAGEIWLAVTPLSFDIAAMELLLPLIRGGRVVIADRMEVADGAEFALAVGRHRVEFLQATPAGWRLLLEGGWGETRWMRALCGGEALPAALAAELVRRSAGVWNLYGPTETTIWSSASRVASDRGGVSIGGPIQNTQMYVLDEWMEPVPVGVIGQIYIGGEGLARGYCRQPGLSAERFVPDELGEGAGGRLYRTGDLGRYRADGALEFVGRCDHQVKLHGFRIELGEVDAALGEHPGVQAVITDLRRNGEGESRLVSYVVRQTEGAPTAGQLQEFLKERLPVYMMPAALVFLPQLPLTSNGKVNRRELPEPEMSPGHYVAPRNAIEEVVAGIWESILGIDGVGIEDNYFELGGHSLQATQLLSRVRAALEVEVSLRQLFESPTVAGLARHIEQARGGARLSPPVVAKERKEDLPLSYGQQRLWFLEQLHPGSGLYNLPRAVRLKGRLVVARLEQSIMEVARRHDVLRTSFPVSSGQARQRVAAGPELSLKVVDLRGVSGAKREEEMRRLLRQEGELPFDLSRGPLLRVNALRLEAEEHVVSLTMHHIISDGWSLGILIREVAKIYEGYGEGQPSPLKELPIQYGDYTIWQRDRMGTAELQSQAEYWKRQLAGISPLLLPTDFPRPTVQSIRGAYYPIAISKETTQSLKQLSNRNSVTLAMTLAAALQVLLSCRSGQEEVVVGASIANRNRFETEGLIGFFVNMLVLRTDLSGNPSFQEILARVRRIMIEAYEHQDLPFDKLVEELQLERDLRQSPLFQVAFLLQNGDLAPRRMADLHLDTVQPNTVTTPFDLTLNLQELSGLNGGWTYCTDLFKPSRIEGMARDYEAILAEVAKSDEIKLENLKWKIEDRSHRERLYVEGIWDQVNVGKLKKTRAVPIVVRERNG
jgi:amino acid adenylation domain-containing protein